MSTDTQHKRPIPRKLNQGMITALSEYIRKGNYAVTACALCDITENQYYLWLEQARQDYSQDLTPQESIYIRLYESIKRAEADAEARLVEVVREAGVVDRQWVPAMTFLERRHPDRWGRRERHDFNVNETKTLNITWTEVVVPQIGQGDIVEGEVKELTDATE